MKNLIIHPKDPSTEFLKPIYSNLEDKTVVTDGITKTELRVLIEIHDRIHVSYTHLRAHETVLDLVCRLLLDKKKHHTP